MLARAIRGVLVVNSEKTHRIVNGFTRSATQAHRNDRGPLGGEGEFSDVVEAGDDVNCGPDAFGVHDSEAIEVGVLCNAEGTTTDRASDMSAIWKGGREGEES